MAIGIIMFILFSSCILCCLTYQPQDFSIVNNFLGVISAYTHIYFLRVILIENLSARFLRFLWGDLNSASLLMVVPTNRKCHIHKFRSVSLHYIFSCYAFSCIAFVHKCKLCVYMIMSVNYVLLFLLYFK